MNTKTLHRRIGLLLLLPILGWALTGIVFLIKPGYEGAYELLAVKLYPLENAPGIEPLAGWYEYRMVRSVLGYHLLAKSAQGWMNLNPNTLGKAEPLNEVQLRTLVEDAISVNPQRYGTITGLSSGQVQTNTGVNIELDWASLSLRQSGRDTRIIGLLYKIHYLQWLGLPILNNSLALLGIILLLALSLFGLMLYLRSHRD